jgi:hypothetical protein
MFFKAASQLVLGELDCGTYRETRKGVEWDQMDKTTQKTYTTVTGYCEKLRIPRDSHISM